MRTQAQSSNGAFRVRIISGTRTVLMALDCDPSRCTGFRGFAFNRKAEGYAEGKWLRSLKVFKSVIPDPLDFLAHREVRITTLEHPIQSFLWSDYTAEPGRQYVFRIVPMYGNPGALKHDDEDAIEVVVRTEPENDPNGHSIWFNRGAIAGQHFAREFGDIRPSAQQLEDLTQPVTQWLSRGLVEACLAFVNDVPAGQAIRGCVYEFTYKPILNALKAAVERGVDIQLSYHKTKPNDQAINDAELPRSKGKRRILLPRTVPEIPHNKFLLRLQDGKAISVWTGSTNLTPSGFLGQSNVGHQINDPVLAESYLRYYEGICGDPDRGEARELSEAVSPNPPEAPEPATTTPFFSPRSRSLMMQWYANRIEDATQSVMFTAAFGVNEKLAAPLAADKDFLRYVMMEKRPKKEMEASLRADRDLVIAYGSVLGQYAYMDKDGKRKTIQIKEFGLDKWFLKEELYRRSGNIFFIHTKFLLIDPLSDDPLVCTGSANFSDNSLLQNDENMLLIRGNTRVADIYVTEFDRLFRHFYFRNVANEIESRGGDAEGAFLDETDSGPKHWTASYFRAGAFKTRRRELFFLSREGSWAGNAKARDEGVSFSSGTAKHASGKSAKTAKAGKKAVTKAARPLKKPAPKKAVPARITKTRKT
jgi:phosphatidylserine/phosphatidylglycerophosphate/cardiolipin synthase-like enzyme